MTGKKLNYRLFTHSDNAVFSERRINRHCIMAWMMKHEGLTYKRLGILLGIHPSSARRLVKKGALLVREQVYLDIDRGLVDGR